MAKLYYRGFYTAENRTFIETDKAIGCDFSFGKWSGTDSLLVWFPKSQLVFENGVNDAGKSSVLVPQWLFRAKKLDPIACDSIAFELNPIEY